MKSLSLACVLFLFAAFTSLAAPPERDLSRWIKSWETSPTTSSHGNIVERAILTPGDPLNPPAQGAVLKYLSRLSRGELNGMVSTKPVKHDGENEMIYIMSGKGRIEGGGKKLPLRQGDAILIPPSLEHVITNETEEPLLMVIAAEPVPKNFKARTDILVRNLLEGNASPGAHWNHVGYGSIGRSDGLYQEEGFALVGVDGMNIAEPHPHVEGTEEIWFLVSGDAYLQLGIRLFHQPAGTAFMTPPDGQTPHATINTSDRLALFLFLARWHEPQ
ncbi:cupin domain-containing protein [bacterium]|nr:cupin domain-containing protein [bacterium]